MAQVLFPDREFFVVLGTARLKKSRSGFLRGEVVKNEAARALLLKSENYSVAW